MKYVHKATPLAPTESPRLRTQPNDTYRSNVFRRNGFSLRSLVLHLSRHRQPTDPGLCSRNAVGSFVKTREPPASRGTPAGCNSPNVRFPALLVFGVEVHESFRGSFHRFHGGFHSFHESLEASVKAFMEEMEASMKKQNRKLPRKLSRKLPRKYLPRNLLWKLPWK